MPASALTELAQRGGYEEFESRCLELLESGEIKLSQLVAPFEQLEQSGHAERLATLTQMVLDLVGAQSDPPTALKLTRIALIGSPDNTELRQLAVDLYRGLYGHTPGFDVILSASGLTGGRPIRMALRLLDLCLTLQPGDPLISRMDDRVVEVAEIDRANGLFTLRQGNRVTTRPAPEVAREFERIAADDFRVMRQLCPEQLAELIEKDPVAVVVGLIRAHGGHVDADLLKHDLVPRHIPPSEWAAWWSRARTRLKRSPHVVIEGRSPIILTYCAAGRTLEEETWEAIESQRELGQRVSLIEGYLRECKSRRQQPDSQLLQRFHNHLSGCIAETRERRPDEALSCALAIRRLEKKGLPATEHSLGLAAELLRETGSPTKLLRRVEPEALRELALAALREARPDDWAEIATAWMPYASANLLDKLASAAIECGRRDDVQRFIDMGLDDPAGNPELLFWLWKGPRDANTLNLPPDDELFRTILDSLSTLGRSIPAEAGVVKTFRQRMRAALGLHDHAKAARCLERASEAAAITFRRQIERLEGVGDNVRSRLLRLLREQHPQLWVEKRRQLQPWEDTETLWCTTQGLGRRTAERDEIVNVKMPQNAKRIGEAASHGDLSENSEYKFALEERDFLRAQLATANDELSRSRVLSPHDVPDDHVGIGSRVLLRRLDDNSQRSLTFLGPFETDVDRQILSYLAPVSQKLMGRRVGDRVALSIDGRETDFEILQTENALDRPGP